MAAPTKSTTARGLGHRHQQQHKRLLAKHVDGTLCWWCGKPMYRDKTHNPDSRTLEADHSKARSIHGTSHLADRLLHSKCNRERGDGSRDHQRPALTGKQTQTSSNDRTKWCRLDW
ncbi:hypothetical protein [Hoyosella altamirensis]|uniref:hypothetical protein n=1 Tax=Hoyosella altamirensis TaxID=616997 RepID=UPI0007DAFE6C|nr:hypothetical protein [Hoyosella altamirensis]